MITIEEVKSLNEIKVEMRVDGKPYYLHDKEGNEMRFPSTENAVGYLMREGFFATQIMAMNFIYTNESRECNCSLCEKRDDCHIRDKFQRLPRNPDGGLGMCPKL